MNVVLVSLVLLIVVGAAGVFMRLHISKRKSFTRYEGKLLFNKNQAVLFGRLREALPDCHIFPHIPLSELMEPVQGDRKRNPTSFDRLTSLKVDFAVFDSDLVLVCVVILETSLFDSDTPESIALRDRCLKSAHIKTIHWNAEAKPSVEQIGRTIAPLISISRAPSESIDSDPALHTGSDPINPDTVQIIQKENPSPSNITGLTLEQLEAITPDKILSRHYPHIWQRICLFSSEPKHLQKYLISLSIQDRGQKRAGFPLEAIKEIADIQAENDRFLARPVTGWQPAVINR